MKKTALSKQICIQILAISLSINLAINLAHATNTKSTTTNTQNPAQSSIFTMPKDLDSPSQSSTQTSNENSTQKNHFLDSALDSIPTTYISAFSATAIFLPAFSLSYALIIKDFLGFRQQAIGWVAVVGATYAVKYLIYFAAPYAPNALSFAKRPRWQSYEAFPSGHTSSAFAAVGFLQKRYGSRLGIPAFIVALAVGESRLLLEKHTLLQVVCGGILGFLLSFFCASPFVKIHTSSILPNLPNKHNKHAPQNHLSQNQQNNQTLYSAFLLALFFV